MKPGAAKPGAKRCIRIQKLKGSFAHHGAAGQNAFRFTGRLRGKALPPAPYRLVAWGQRVVLRYPAPMRMTALAPDRLRAVVAEHGGEVVDSVSEDIPVSHWRSTRYVVRKR